MTNFAFIGFRHGHIYGLYNQVSKHPQTVVKICWEEDAESRQKAESILGAEFLKADYDDILADPSINVVAVGDYYGIRGERIIKALKAGKHVISDKPICTNLKELGIIESLIKEKGLKLGCMLDLRYMPAAVNAKAVIESGEIGNVNCIAFTGQHYLDLDNRPKWYLKKANMAVQLTTLPYTV